MNMDIHITDHGQTGFGEYYPDAPADRPSPL